MSTRAGMLLLLATTYACGSPIFEIHETEFPNITPYGDSLKIFGVSASAAGNTFAEMLVTIEVTFSEVWPRAGASVRVPVPTTQWGSYGETNFGFNVGPQGDLLSAFLYVGTQPAYGSVFLTGYPGQTVVGRGPFFFPTPEPSTSVLMLGGVAFLAARFFQGGRAR